MAHWDSDNFRQLVGVMVADRRFQGRVGRCRGLYQQRHLVGFLDGSLPAIHRLARGQNVHAGRQMRRHQMSGQGMGGIRSGEIRQNQQDFHVLIVRWACTRMV